jgi:hypothetical protein
MKTLILLASVLFVVDGADKKGLPNQAGNDDIELAGTVTLDRQEIQSVLGADLGAGYAVVQIKVTPKAERPIQVGADDFTLLSRKDGEKSPALSPSQIAGRGAMVVKPGKQLTGLGTSSNGPIWGGIGTSQPRRFPGKGGSAGGGPVESGTADASIDKESRAPENPLLAPLKAKGLAEAETNQPAEGLLYFAIEGKNKPKDLSLLYKGAAGRLVIDFK